MRDAACVAFLQWALPGLNLRWTGMRRVRHQVCKRLAHRLHDLNLRDLEAYQAYLTTHPHEWTTLDALCRITISRWYRDWEVWTCIEHAILPMLAHVVAAQGHSSLRSWSAGCASGEEPYTLALVWKLAIQPRFPAMQMQIIATDADPHMVQRAQTACYPMGSLKDLPPAWRQQAFVSTAQGYDLREDYRTAVWFRQQDMRQTAPSASFHLILCRNVAFTYFDTAVQRAVLQRLLGRLEPGGVLIIGRREALPDVQGVVAWPMASGVYRKVDASA